MPATSEKMRRLMCLALSIKLKKTPASRSVEAAKVAESMTIKELSEFCKSVVKK